MLLNVLTCALVALACLVAAFALERRAPSRAARAAGQLGCLALGVCAGAGVVAELLAGFVYDVPRVRVTNYREYAPGRFALAPNLHVELDTTNPAWPFYLVDTNADGLRTRAAPWRPGEAPSRRVMFLGDSFTFGAGLAEGETMPARAEALLRARDPASNWVAVNAGVPGYNLFSEVALLEWLADRYRPAAVVLVLQSDDALPDMSDGLREAARGLQGQPLHGRFALARFLRAGGDLARYRALTVRDVSGRVRIPPEREAERARRLDDAAARLDGLRRRLGFALYVAFLQDAPHETHADGKLRATVFAPLLRAGARGVVLHWRRGEGGDSIPLDGHPSPRGAARLAAELVPALLEAP